MDFLLIVVVTLAVTSVTAGALVARGRSIRRLENDQFLRAGQGREVSQYSASRRAQGLAAWTRIGGGGV
jgi:hypothetical protein